MFLPAVDKMVQHTVFTLSVVKVQNMVPFNEFAIDLDKAYPFGAASQDMEHIRFAIRDTSSFEIAASFRTFKKDTIGFTEAFAF